MKLQTTGSLQVHGFQRKIKTGNMKLMLKDPQDKTAPEFYMKDAQKKFWRKLSSAERKKTIKKADIQCQKSDFMEHSKVNAEPVLELSRNKEKDTGQTGSGMLRFQHRKILYRQTGDRISGKKKGQRSGVKTNPS